MDSEVRSTMQQTSEQSTLHPNEFFLLWFTHHKLKDLPAFLRVNTVGHTRAERSEHTATASKTLASRDLGTIENPAVDLLKIVNLLAMAPVRIEFGLAGLETAAWTVVAIGDSQAAVATRMDMQVRLWAGEASRTVKSLLESIPPMQPGKGTPANVPVADFNRACEAGATKGTLAFRKVLHDAGVHNNDIPTISRAVETRSGGGMLAGTRRDPTDTWRHTTLQISWLDTATGRYTIRQDPAWVTVVPTDSTRLRSMASQVLEEFELLQ